MSRSAKCSTSLAGTSAAQYVRMSTDYQQYSTESQKREISEFAASQNITIVATYEDAGRSGVTLRGRPALSQLLEDVQSATRVFDVLLVFDVSRWGRFQDVDESAHYEYMCRQAGVQVVYCGESFVNDGSSASNLMKTLKRAMAGEYSRELSRKVFVGQCRLAARGFWQGAPPGYGLQRMLVDAAGNAKGRLGHLEHKNIQTDRVTVVLGADHEVALVRRIYDWYIGERIGARKIAARLNSFGIYNGHGRPWNAQQIDDILTNEKYTGTNLYARTSKKLSADWRRNPPAEWARSVGAFPAVVDRATFDTVARIRAHKTQFLGDDELLQLLDEFVNSAPLVTVKTIDEEPSLPASQTYARRFGGILNAYSRIGYEPGYHGAPPEVFRATRRALKECVDGTIAELEEAGRQIEVSADNCTIRVGGELVIKFVVRSILHYDRRSPRWKVRWPILSSPDFLVIARLDSAYETPIDFYVFPRGSLTPGQEVAVSFGTGRSEPLEMFRFPDKTILLELTARSRLEAMYGNATPQPD